MDRETNEALSKFAREMLDMSRTIWVLEQITLTALADTTIEKPDPLKYIESLRNRTMAMMKDAGAEVSQVYSDKVEALLTKVEVAVIRRQSSLP